ncbi:MAG: DUF3549 family protein, partial [Chromatiales bacterium]|nr:DUF3549 family protein [Chromatiales bacterium]
PLQQQAWFALIFQDTEKQVEPFIWFLRFPLDEQGKLLQASRDDFMHRLMERIGENLQAAKEGSTLDAALKDNPYTFKPRDDRMAVFHAKAKQLFKQPASKYFEHAEEYFSGKLGWDQWSFVGYQGIAELAVSQDQAEITKLLIAAIPQLPEKPLEALCHCLENETINMALNQTLLERLEQHLDSHADDTLTTAACVRAVACSQSANLQKAVITIALEHDSGRSADVLAAISGRCWETLLDDDIRLKYLEQLARNDNGQEFFNQCLSDLLFIPGMRVPLLTSIRNPERSTELSNAIGSLFQGLNSNG